MNKRSKEPWNWQAAGGNCYLDGIALDVGNSDGNLHFQHQCLISQVSFSSQFFLCASEIDVLARSAAVVMSQFGETFITVERPGFYDFIEEKLKENVESDAAEGDV